MASNSNSQVSELKKDTLTDPELLNLELPKDMIHAMINEAFYMFDEDHSGDIDKREFKNLIRSINPDIPNTKIIELMKTVDKDNSGKIDKQEFTYMMMEQFKNLQKEVNVEKGKTRDDKVKKSPVTVNLELVFNLYDKDMDGKISNKDFVESSKDLGDENPLDEEEGKILIDIAKLFWRERLSKLNNNKESPKDENPECITKDEFLYLLLNLKFVEEAKIDKTLDKKEGSANNLKEVDNLASKASYTGKGNYDYN